MTIRVLFGLGLCAVFELLSLIVPAQLLPLEQAAGFLDEQLSASRHGVDPGAPQAETGSIVLWNRDGAPVLQASIAWPDGSQGCMNADSTPLAQYDSFVLEPGLASVQTVDVSVLLPGEEVSRSFTFDFSAGALIAAVRGSGQDGWQLELFEGVSP